jgi:hypothetical protein
MKYAADNVDLEYFNNTLLSSLSPNPGTYYFMNEDSEENWNVNKIKYADICQQHYYSNTSIVYHINKLGHRNKLNPDPVNDYNLYLGCSHTFGIGLPAGALWHNHVHELFDNACYNAGIAGGSTGACYRQLIGLHAYGMRIKRIFMLVPNFQRFEIFDNRWKPVAWWTDHHKAVKKTLLNQNLFLLEQQKSIDAIKGFCLSYNIEHVILDSNDHEIDKILTKDRTARDFIHSGPEAHFKLSKVFYEKYTRDYCST